MHNFRKRNPCSMWRGKIIIFLPANLRELIHYPTFFQFNELSMPNSCRITAHSFIFNPHSLSGTENKLRAVHTEFLFSFLSKFPSEHSATYTIILAFMRKTDSSVGTDIESGKCYYARPQVRFFDLMKSTRHSSGLHFLSIRLFTIMYVSF